MINPMMEQMRKSANNMAGLSGAGSGMPTNPMQMMQQFAEFKKMMRGRNPQQMVQKLLSTNQMTAQQFEQLKGMANELKNILR